MITTIDKAGRIVIPKPLRDMLGVGSGGEVELDVDDDGRIVMSIPDVPKRLVGPPGRRVVVADGDMPPLTVELVRDTLEKIRRGELR